MPPQENPPRIFISYARKDGEDIARELRQKLEAPPHRFSVWQDRAKVEGTKKWWNQIEEAIKSVEYMVLIMTEVALKSEIVEKEWKFARQEGKGVIPVIGSRDLDFDSMPKWMKAEHFVDIEHEEQWQLFLETLKKDHQPSPVKYVEDKLPYNFVERPREFEPLLNALLDSEKRDAIAITATLQGAGGFGKTTIARALCHHPKVKDAYFDGIHWVTIGESPGDLSGKVLDLIGQMSTKRPGYETLEIAGDRLAESLGGRTILLVIDDVWDPAHLTQFLKGGPNCTRLITTRNKHVVPPNAKSVVVDKMQNDEALAVLRQSLPEGHDVKLQGLVDRLGHWPLLLNLVASVLREGMKQGESFASALSYIEKGLHEEGLTAFDVENVEDRNMAVAATINVSTTRLTESSRDRFQELGIFPEDTRIPFRAVEVFWGQTGGLTPFKVEKVVKVLSRFSLLWDVSFEKKYLQLHDVFRGYLRTKKKDELVELQRAFLDAWKGSQPWSCLDKSEPYIWHNLAWHLVEADRQEELEDLCIDYSWLQAKLDTTDPVDLLKDFGFVPKNDCVEKVAAAIRLSAHVIGKDPTQLPGQLIGRLEPEKQPEIQSLLIEAQKNPAPLWLRPLQGNLTTPGGPLLQTFKGHRSQVNSVVVTPNGKCVISASDDHTCKVWDLASGKVELTLSGHSDSVKAVTVTPDGMWAISASYDATLKIWDLASGKELRTLHGHSSAVDGVAVTPDGIRVVSAADDYTLIVWDLQSGNELLRLHGHSSSVSDVAVTPDSTCAISAGADHTCRVWDISNGKELKKLLGHSDSVTSVVVTPDGTRLISAANDYSVVVWNLALGREEYVFTQHSDRVSGLTVTPDGTRAISASGDGTIKIWDLAVGLELQTLNSNSVGCGPVTVTPDGKQLISGGNNNTLKVWDLLSGLNTPMLFGFHEGVRHMEIMPNGMHAVSTGAGEIKLWDLGRCQEFKTLPRHSTSKAIMPMITENKQLILEFGEYTFTALDWESGKKLQTFYGHDNSAFLRRNVAITEDGTQIISVWKGKLKVWDFLSGREVLIIGGHKESVNAVTVIPSSRLVISASSDKTCKVWDLTSGRLVHTLIGHNSAVNMVTVTLDGSHAISASIDGMVRVWDLASGEVLNAMSGHRSWVNALIVTRDGMQAISASDDEMLKLWSLVDGKEIATFTGDSPILCCVVSSDGKTVMAGEESGRVHFLRLEGVA